MDKFTPKDLNSDDEIIFDEEEAIKYIMERIDCTKEDCDTYYAAQMDFYEEKGMVLSEEELLQKLQEGEPEEPEVIYLDEMAEFIASRTSLPIELVNRLMDADNEYLEMIGIAGPASTE